MERAQKQDERAQAERSDVGQGESRASVAADQQADAPDNEHDAPEQQDEEEINPEASSYGSP